MLTDLRSALFWLTASLLFLVILQHGCSSRMEQFHQWRQERQQQRDERREDRHGDHDDDGSGRRHWWRDRGREQPDSTMPEAEHHATQVFHVHIFTA